MQADRFAPLHHGEVGHIHDISEWQPGTIVRTRHRADFYLIPRTACSREKRMECGHALEVREEPRRGFSRERTTVVYQMHLIVEFVIVGDATPRTAGPSEFVIQGGIEPDDSSVKFRRHADLREETPLELPW